MFNQWFNIIAANEVYWLLFIVWVLIWKGFALWKAAGKQQKIWFVVLLVINTAGLLEILYLFVFSKMKRFSKKEHAMSHENHGEMESNEEK